MSCPLLFFFDFLKKIIKKPFYYLIPSTYSEKNKNNTYLFFLMTNLIPAKCNRFGVFFCLFLNYSQLLCHKIRIVCQYKKKPISILPLQENRSVSPDYIRWSVIWNFHCITFSLCHLVRRTGLRERKAIM